jgi:hypothetical protein
MPLIRRRNILGKIAAPFTMATADDLDGTNDGTQYLALNARQRAIIIQQNSGTAGTAGIDVVERSVDGGTWHADPTLQLIATADFPGAAVSNAALNAAGVEPTLYAAFKSGPHGRNVRLRLSRKTTETAGTTWVTGAPAVLGIKIG